VQIHWVALAQPEFGFDSPWGARQQVAQAVRRARRLGSFLREFIDVQHQVDYPPTNQLGL
jgi:hypothetical protein